MAPHLRGENLGRRLIIVRRALVKTAQFGKAQTDYAFPIFMLTEAPFGVKGLLLVGIFAAAMSSVSSALSALASVSVMDLGLGKSAKSDEAKLKLSRKATIFWGIALVGVWTRGGPVAEGAV